jgi:hypothetical protein
VYEGSDKIKMAPNSRLFVNAYPAQICTSTLNFFEIVCSLTGKSIMPPLCLELCSSAKQFFRKSFQKIRPFVQSSGAILLNNLMSDDEAFWICFAKNERLVLFQILLVYSNDEEVYLDELSENAIDW